MANQLNPHISVDCVIFGFDFEALRILLVDRELSTSKIPAVKKDLKLPGSLVYDDEDLDTSASRVLKELTGLENIFLRQFHVFGSPARVSNKIDLDWLTYTTSLPISRVVTIAYYSLVKIDEVNSADKLAMHGAHWVALDDVDKLAFDHNEILHTGLETLRSRLRAEPIGFELLPKKFTIRQLQTLYEVISSQKLDSRNFRKKIAKLRYLIPLQEREKKVAHKPAQLYKFDKRLYYKTRKENFVFTL
jgi:hypothetical protein